jgi:hypothetical protein
VIDVTCNPGASTSLHRAAPHDLAGAQPSPTLAHRECPRCGGTVAGEIAHPDQRLDAEEALAAGKDTGHA